MVFATRGHANSVSANIQVGSSCIRACEARTEARKLFSERSFLSWLSCYCPEGGSSCAPYLRAVSMILCISANSG
jgi:hypothetical protein